MLLKDIFNFNSLKYVKFLLRPSVSFSVAFGKVLLLMHAIDLEVNSKQYNCCRGSRKVCMRSAMAN